MNFLQNLKKLNLFQQSAERFLWTMVDYVYCETRPLSSANLPSLPESIINIHELFSDPTRISNYQRIVVPLKVPG